MRREDRVVEEALSWMPLFQQQPGLLARFRAGERDALAHVYRTYLPKIEALVRGGFLRGGRAHVKGLVQPAEVADAVQEVFCKAFSPSGRQGYDGVREYGPYLYMIARNVIVSRYRRAGREIATDSDQLERAVEAVPPPPDDDVPWANPQTMTAVKEFLSSLPEELKAVHEARFVRGLSQRDGAEALGMTRRRMRTLEGRLRTGLRRLLKHRALIAG